MTRVAIAGHFNPLHVGHLSLIKDAQRFGDEIIVIVANDIQAALKRIPVFIPVQERAMIMACLESVNDVVISIDKGSSIKETLRLVRPDVLVSGCDINHPDAIEEQKVCDELGIKTVWNAGGGKIRSSSEILAKYKGKKK